mmetsp:Transcript_13213/g.50606  ORF Transcript_13213/g.50606 Transcript_13213/m.50606 type:complete len:202 (-) Transcript_13213:340-945(-)
MWPSRTCTRLAEAERGNTASVKPVPVLFTPPRILRYSSSSLASSPPMRGMTLSSISSALRPGYPAPEMACIVVTMAASMPNARSMGSRAHTRPVVEQLALVTMNAPESANERCERTTSRWSGFTGGTTRGTLGTIRELRALLNTGTPADTKLASIVPATEASRAENTKSTSPNSEGSQFRTVCDATAAGTSPSSVQCTAFP